MLTDTTIRTLKPRDIAYRVADTNGLCIDVCPSGAKAWRYRYRYAGKPRIITMPGQVIDDEVDECFKGNLLLFAAVRPERDELKASALPISNSKQVLEAALFQRVAFHFEIEIPLIGRRQPLEPASVPLAGRSSTALLPVTRFCHCNRA